MEIAEMMDYDPYLGRVTENSMHGTTGSATATRTTPRSSVDRKNRV